MGLHSVRSACTLIAIHCTYLPPSETYAIQSCSMCSIGSFLSEDEVSQVCVGTRIGRHYETQFELYSSIHTPLFVAMDKAISCKGQAALILFLCVYGCSVCRLVVVVWTSINLIIVSGFP